MSELIPSEITRPAPRAGRRTLGVLPLVGIFFFTVSGGPFGLENSLSSAGPGMTLLMIVLVPVAFGVPNALVAAELSAAIPVDGGYYYWTKIALGKGAAFVFGAWNSIGSVLNLALVSRLRHRAAGGTPAHGRRDRRGSALRRTGTRPAR